MISKISIVIRSLNERERLRELLEAIRLQKCSLPVEIVVVDNESHDGTAELARRLGAIVVHLPRKCFSYPRSMNVGVEAATGDVVILTVGHALPLRENWIACAAEHFQSNKVSGLYSPVIPKTNGTIADWILLYPGYVKAKILGLRKIRAMAPGVFAATNCAFRKKDWEETKFNESYGLGGEDTLWAGQQIRNGKIIICDPNFAVRHCHYLSLIGLLAQIKYWTRLSRPSKFSRDALKFRSDLDFS